MFGWAVAVGVLAAGCGGSPSTVSAGGGSIPGPVDPGTAGTLSIHMVPDGLPGALAPPAAVAVAGADAPVQITAINLVLATLELRTAGTDDGWRPVPLTAPVPAGLPASAEGLALALYPPGPMPLVLASQVLWPPGSYDAIRYTLAAGGSFQTSDGDTHDLPAPGPFIRSMGLPEAINVVTQAATDLWITFSVASVIEPDTANPGSFLLLPGPVRGYDRAQTGTIQGTLRTPDPAAAPSAPPVALAGATVTAQLELPAGAPSATIPFRTAVTADDGSFTLDLLPRNYTWCVVTQPLVTSATGVTASYAAGVSPDLALGSPPYDKLTIPDLVLALAPLGGTLSGKVATLPGPGQAKWVQVNQPVNLGGAPFMFVLRAQPVAADGSFAFPLLPPGAYAAEAETYTQDPTTDLLFSSQTTTSFDLEAGDSLSITFP